MRQGLFPGQMEMLRELARKGLDAERRTRRNLIASVLACAGVGTSAFVIGRHQGEAANPVRLLDPRLLARRDQARRLAAQPDAVLRRDHATFLLIFEGTGSDDGLWIGFARLANMALADPSAAGHQLARRLLTTTSTVAPPDHLTPLIHRLREFVR